MIHPARDPAPDRNSTVARVKPGFHPGYGTAEMLSKRIVLIDGDQLTTLMIRHSVGCRVEETLHIKKIGEDFFEQDL